MRQQTKSGPGPNYWSEKNVWVDKKGNLHLYLRPVKTERGDRWECAEITSKKKFGRGTYQFQTVGRLDNLDKNVVFGIFDYPVYNEDPDGTNEIDIEFAWWGNAAYPNGNFTVYPATGPRDKAATHAFEYALPKNTTANVVTTHRFTRTAKAVQFSVQTGAKSIAPLVQWEYAPKNARLVPQKPLAIHLNLWLYGGSAPENNQPLEIVVTKFTFTPTP